jgi:DNA-binding MarR family transcriptional regulator
MTDQRPIGFWLQLVDGLITTQFETSLDEHGVTRRQWQLLNVLDRQPSSVEALDAAVSPFLAEGESSAEHLTELIESGWVDATPTGYELTDRGRTAFEKLATVVGANREVVAAGLTEQEYATTVATLERMARNLGWSGE